MKKVIVVLLFCISTTGFAQKFLNLDFEYTSPGSLAPMKWSTGGPGYIVEIDEAVKTSKLKSLKIASNNPAKSQFGVCTGYFPAGLVKGKNIEFTGMIRSEQITDGYAGLWWRVDGENGTLGFDNMSNRGLKGTNDWKKVSIKMKVDEKAVTIYFGALFPGKGTAWFDNFEIFIDGEKFIDTEPRTSDPTKEELAWLKQHIYPLQTYEPGADSDKDLKILEKLIGTSKVVALGETTHGSSEIFKMKHRIIKYLSENAGFNIFSIEANMPESYRLNEYIIEGKGDPAELIKGMYFWTWRTKEVLDMVEWMKQYANGPERKISFTGFDMQYHWGAISEVNKAFNDREEVIKVLAELKTTLDEISNERRNNMQYKIPQGKTELIAGHLNSIRNFISSSNFQASEKIWLLQNVRVIEQSMDSGARDKYMAENLLWIKSQNPDSKITAWAHNGHIRESGNAMGKYLSEALKEDYLTIGFTFHKGSYTAVGNNGLSTYQAQDSYPGTYEYFFNSIDEPVFILDLREVKKESSESARWLQQELLFRSVGAVKMTGEFSETNLTSDFDLIIFIKESTNSTLLN